MIRLLIFKNLFGHKRRSLLILILFTSITALFHLGNAMLAESSKGMKKTYVENITGDLIIKTKTDIAVSLFGASTPTLEDFYILPSLEAKEGVLDIVQNTDAIEKHIGLLYGAASLELGGRRQSVPLFGIEGESHFDFFPEIELIEGRFLESGEQGAMINEKLYKTLLAQDESFSMGSPAVFTMAGKRGVKIREVPLVGVFKYSGSDELLDSLVLSDIKTLQDLNSISSTKGLNQEIDEDTINLFDESLDDLFSDDMFEDDFFGDDDLFGEDSFVEADKSEGGVLDDWDSLLGSGEVVEEGSSLSGDWHFILLRLKNPRSASKVARSLELQFEQNNFNVDTMNWRQGAGFTAQMVYLLKVMFNAGFILIALAGVVAMVNILLIAVMDRTSEMGTLRAIGSRKSDIAGLVLGENIILASTGGLFGVSLAHFIIELLNEKGVYITNPYLQSLLGQTTLSINPEFYWAFISFAVAIILGLIASWYPMSHAMSISPSIAQSQGDS